VFSLNFHHLLTVFLFPLQVCVYVLLQLLVLPNVTSFFCCQIQFGKFLFSFFYTMVIVQMKEIRLVVEVDNLNF